MRVLVDAYSYKPFLGAWFTHFSKHFCSHRKIFGLPDAGQADEQTDKGWMCVRANGLAESWTRKRGDERTAVRTNDQTD